MQITSDAIFEAAMKLSENERIALICRLEETLPPEEEIVEIMSSDDPQLHDELLRRRGDLGGSVPWSELRGEKWDDNGG